MGFWKKVMMLTVADAACMTGVWLHRKAKFNYATGKTVFGKPKKKKAVRKVNGKTYIFMGKEDYRVA